MSSPIQRLRKMRTERIVNEMGTPPQTPPPFPSRAQWKAQRAQWKMQSQMQREAYRAQFRSYSRGSLVGPLLLLGIGIVALLITTHHIDAAGFWHWYGRWWPLILIAAGVVLGLESLAFSNYSRIRLGGGVVLLAIVLACLGIAAAHKNINWSAIGDQLDMGNGNINLAQIFGDKHEATEQVEHALPANGTLIIQNPHGNVTIASGSGTGDGQMHLALDKFVYSSSDSDAKRKLQALEPLITSNGGVITVHMPTSDRQTADMNITVPATTALQVRAGHGDVTIHDRQAAVDVTAEHGDIRLTGIAATVHAVMHDGDFSASNIKGDLNLSGRMDDVTLSQVTGATALDGDFFGDVRLEKLQGRVHLHSSRTDIQTAQLAGTVSLDSDNLTVENATGPVVVATEAKDIAVRRITGEVRVHNANGDVVVSTLNPVGAMNIENRNGSVQLTLPADAKFSVQATAVDGEVHSDFPLTTSNVNDHSTASGAVGGGGPLVHITAEKGDITLHRD